MNHTPGPWKVALRQIGYYGRNVIAPHGKNWIRVCSIDYPKAARWHREGVANSHLISAAPELLESLRAMVDRWEPDCEGQDRIMWENARAAIAKATSTEEDL